MIIETLDNRTKLLIGAQQDKMSINIIARNTFINDMNTES